MILAYKKAKLPYQMSNLINSQSLIFLCVLFGFLVFAERRIPANRRVIFVFEDFFAKKTKTVLVIL